MTQYLISMYQPEGGVPAPDVLEKIMAELDVLNDEIKATGGWIFTGGLTPASTATVLRPRGGDVVATDGPFAESKEHLGGFWVVDAPDRDTALRWGRAASRATGLPVEVRAFTERVASGAQS